MALGKPNLQVIGPETQVRELVSALDKSLLGDGQFQQLKNTRADGGLPYVRNADTVVLARPSWASSAEPLASRTCKLNGQVYEVAVWSDGSKGRIAVIPPGLARWVEVTGAAAWTGPSGNNRFTDFDNPCQLTVIKTPRYLSASGTFSSRDAVLIVNGEDYPRIWDPETSDYDSYNVTAVANSGGKFQLTIGAHNLKVGDHTYLASIGGLSQLTGLWQLSAVTATTITLQDSTYAAGYTAGGTVQDRVDLLVHKPITEPSTIGQSFATVSSYWTVSTSTRPTYAAPAGVVNQNNRYEMQDWATAPYTGANNVPELLIGATAAAGDIATMQMSTGITLGPQLIMLLEGAGAYQAIKQSKIELGVENAAYAAVATWLTLYDPTGSDAVARNFVSIVQDSTNNRVWLVFNTGQYAGSSGFNIRFTRQGPAPAAQQDIRVLFVGCPSGDVPATTEWVFAYEDAINKVETRRRLMTAGADNIGMLGGPQSVIDGSSTTLAPSYPLDRRIIADWRFQYANSNTSGSTSTITGGLDGVAEKLNLYCLLPAQTDYYFLVATGLYSRGFSAGTRAWSNTTTPLIITNTFPSNVKQSLINTNRVAPSDYQLPIPICAVCHFDQGRLFVAAVKDASGQYGYSDEYFSWLRNPFRMQQVQEDEIRGGYNQVAGQTIKAIVSSSAAALGSARVFVITDQHAFCHGDSGPYLGSAIGTSDLSRLMDMGPYGTLAPMSVTVGPHAIFWIDQNSQVVRLSEGRLVRISTRKIHDKLNTMASTRRQYASGTFNDNRFMLAYSPSGATTNTRVHIWNEDMAAWEAEDSPTVSAAFGQLHPYDTPTSSLAKVRVFFYDTDGELHAYAEDTSTAVAIQITTREYQFKGWETWYPKKVIATATKQASKALSIARVSRKYGSSEPWTTSLSIDDSTAVFATYVDSSTHAKTGTVRAEKDWAWYLDITATLPPGTMITRLEFSVEGNGDVAGLGTA